MCVCVTHIEDWLTVGLSALLPKKGTTTIIRQSMLIQFEILEFRNKHWIYNWVHPKLSRGWGRRKQKTNSRNHSGKQFLWAISVCFALLPGFVFTTVCMRMQNMIRVDDDDDDDDKSYQGLLSCLSSCVGYCKNVWSLYINAPPCLLLPPSHSHHGWICYIALCCKF